MKYLNHEEWLKINGYGERDIETMKRSGAIQCMVAGLYVSYLMGQGLDGEISQKKADELVLYIKNGK